jgi:predicted AAA+ superfamily ATPase
MTGYKPRAIARLVEDSLTEMPVVIVKGLRQSGKTLFLEYETASTARL